ncbi:winged helix family transcriptional regulator [Antarcticimicrobium luteum]|uniref:Winged helix family transcriptional regulator n=1 Tax=Antarcticimicrobium luteum TaxID=2547397 RepID=A0A4R5V1U9_9RHOB|nr:winged helix family transcriptional regulator [Antarcticimicrobium luteum]
MRFAPDFSFAERPDRERVTFTRSEKRALEILCRHPNRLLTRDQILDALTGSGSDKGDRNIDFLINRLRRKLSDNARDPRYIATRYGEGYVWIGPPPGVVADLADAFLVVGPLRGLDNLSDCHSLAHRFAADLRASLSADLPPAQRVALAPDCPPATDFADQRPSLSVELSFFEECGVVNCVAAARDFPTGRILAILRVSLPTDIPAGTNPAAADAAKQLLNNTWRTLATETDSGLPLPVLIHLAATEPDHSHGAATDSDRRLDKLNTQLENRSMAAWQENETRLRGLMEVEPGDAGLKILYATHIHSKYISFGHRLFRAGIDTRAEDEDRIEALVLAALPHVQSEPEYAIMAAKLLHFLDRGYFDLAHTLSEEALASSVAPAGSLVIAGQLRAFAGETEAALRCFDQALNLVAHGSKAHLYALTLKIQALRAVADFDRLNLTKRELYGISTAAMLFFEPMFADPDNLSIRARAVVRMLSYEKAAALLRMNHYTSARLFRDAEHRANSILTPLTLVIRRFGKARLPEEIASAYPELLDRMP